MYLTLGRPSMTSPFKGHVGHHQDVRVPPPLNEGPGCPSPLCPSISVHVRPLSGPPPAVHIRPAHAEGFQHYDFHVPSSLLYVRAARLPAQTHLYPQRRQANARIPGCCVDAGLRRDCGKTGF